MNLMASAVKAGAVAARPEARGAGKEVGEYSPASRWTVLDEGSGGIAGLQVLHCLGFVVSLLAGRWRYAASCGGVAAAVVRVGLLRAACRLRTLGVVQVRCSTMAPAEV